MLTGGMSSASSSCVSKSKSNLRARCRLAYARQIDFVDCGGCCRCRAQEDQRIGAIRNRQISGEKLRARPVSALHSSRNSYRIAILIPALNLRPVPGR